MNFIEGQTLLVDKPYGWTSFDVVNKIRWHLKRKLQVKKIKVGHAGTLDPLATGLLVICTGKHTKKIETLSAEQKGYSGTFLLGKTTPSYDLETEFNEDFPVDHINEALLESTKQKFVGKIMQVPPLFSAKQIGGKRAYEYARKGIEIELKANTIEIEHFEINYNAFPEITFNVICSKGTYIRSLAQDFGKALQSGATLTALRRTSSGKLHIDQAKKLEEWLQIIDEFSE